MKNQFVDYLVKNIKEKKSTSNEECADLLKILVEIKESAQVSQDFDTVEYIVKKLSEEGISLEYEKRVSVIMK